MKTGQRYVRIRGVNINHHIANLAVGLQVLGRDVDVVRAKHRVDLLKHTRHIAVNVQQAVLARVGGQGDFRKIDRRCRCAVV